MTSTRAPFGALFDWDGVMIDSRALHERAWNEVAAEFGYRHTRADFDQHFGSQNERAISEVLCWTKERGIVARISKRKEELYREQLAAAQTLVMPASNEFRQTLSQRNVPCAVVSSAPLSNIRTVLARFSSLDGFDSFVTADDVSRGKPAPDTFLIGAERLKVAPERCVVFEDAPVGIEAARAAGMRVVALCTTHGASSLAAADRVVEQLTPALIDEIAAWF